MLPRPILNCIAAKLLTGDGKNEAFEPSWLDVPFNIFDFFLILNIYLGALFQSKELKHCPCTDLGLCPSRLKHS